MPSGAKNLVCHNPNLLSSFPLAPISVKVKEAVVENQAVLSYAVDREEHTYLSAAVRPDNKVGNVLVCTTLLELFGFIFSFV